MEITSELEKPTRVAAYMMAERGYVVVGGTAPFKIGERLHHFGGNGYLGSKWRLEIKETTDRADWDEQFVMLFGPDVPNPDDSSLPGGYYRCELIRIRETSLRLEVVDLDYDDEKVTPDDTGLMEADEYVRKRYGDDPGVGAALKLAEEAVEKLQEELDRASTRRIRAAVAWQREHGGLTPACDGKRRQAPRRGLGPNRGRLEPPRPGFTVPDSFTPEASDWARACTSSVELPR